MLNRYLFALVSASALLITTADCEGDPGGAGGDAGIADCSAPSPAHAHVERNDVGVCAIVCDDGWGDCDGQPDNGCESDLNSLSTCGACDRSCDEGNPCTVDACMDGKCVNRPLPGGTICEGSASDPIHGECDSPPAAVCQLQDPVCLKNGFDAPCAGGHCTVGGVCCSGGCIDSSGYCTFGPAGGNQCPMP